MISKEYLDNLKSKLEKEKADLEKELSDLNLEKIPEMGSDVDHFDEEADEAEEFTTNVGIANAIKERISDIETALKKIKAGTYGVCEKCDGEIGADILNVNPESRLCKPCKQEI